MSDFINLLKPGQLPELRQIVSAALEKVPTARMLAVDPVQIRGIGTSITNVITAASLPILAVAGSKESAGIQRVVNQYRTLPTFLTAYTTPTNPALIAASKIVGPPPGTTASSGAAKISLATDNEPFSSLIDYINSTLQNFDSGLIYDLVQQNSAKKDTPTLDGLTKVVQEYIKYLNSIVRIFTLDDGTLNKNYYRIIAAIENILTKLAIIVPSARTPPTASIDNVFKPLKEVPLPIPLKPQPPGDGKYISSYGYNTPTPNSPDVFITCFPDASVITATSSSGVARKVLLKSDAYVYGPNPARGGMHTWLPSYKPRPPPVGARMTYNHNSGGLNPQIKVLKVEEVPLPSAGKYDPVGAKGYLLTVDSDLDARHSMGQGLFFYFSWTPTDAEKAEEAGYHLILAKWQQQNRTTPAAIYNEVILAGDMELNNAVWGDGILKRYPLPLANIQKFNNPKFIANIKKFPAMWMAMKNYIKSNSTFLKKINSWTYYGPHNHALGAGWHSEAPAIIDPDFYWTRGQPTGMVHGYLRDLNSSNFVSLMIQVNLNLYSILNMVPRWLYGSYVDPLYWSLKNNTMTDEDKVILTSILTKVIGMHVNFMNYRASLFDYNIMDDLIARPHIAVFNETFAGLGIAIQTTLKPLRGGSKRRVQSSLKRRSRSVKRSKGTRKH